MTIYLAVIDHIDDSSTIVGAYSTRDQAIIAGTKDKNGFGILVIYTLTIDQPAPTFGEDINT